MLKKYLNFKRPLTELNGKTLIGVVQTKTTLILMFSIFSLTNCVETFDIPPEVDETVLSATLIIEATITNELKRQKILLSRPSNFDVVNDLDSIYDPRFPEIPKEPNFNYEENAQVSVVDNRGNEYEFVETSPGTYLSNDNFAAEKDVPYTLNVLTDKGTSYVSSAESFSSVGQIEELYAERDFNVDGEEGVFIYLDGGSTNTSDKYYRYTYEESYKIIAPEWSEEDFVLTNYDPCALPTVTYDLEIVKRENEEGKVCYKTDYSNTIIQNSTVGLQENRAVGFPVRFLNRNNYIISHRYSILVKQYFQSVDAYNYYRTLESFGSSESIFSTVQPGLLIGNIKSENEGNAQVVGYFEVASVTEKRVYFNYEDLFPEEALPAYDVNCFPFSPPLEHPSYCYTGEINWPCPISILEGVNVNLFAYYGENTEGIGACPGPYLVTFRACSDCTVLGDSAIPDFWED
ncbi:DUF4249 domain-containing protein [Maribacter arcticus]|uniref:DUF4249 domain-containing protein n=1 Tax=Maribacter arcticus TaxID=561365 RepID=UPI0030039CB8